MISLARHIEILLLDHDCVIVPGLGGFIANHAEARYCGDGENLFLPPFRTVGFNQQLQVNDGLLVQSYMAAYDASYPAAYLQMESDIEKIVNELEMNGEHTLENIGILKKDIHQNIVFIAPETGVTTPSLYGLYSYEIKSLASVIKEREIEQSLNATAPLSSADTQAAASESQKSPTHVIIRLHRHWLDVGIAAAAAILLLIGISYPALKNVSTETDTVIAAFYPFSKSTDTPAPGTQPAPAIATPPISEASRKAAVPAPRQAEHPSETEKSPEATDTPGQATPQPLQYTIVLASYVSERNAKTFIQHLSEAGMSEGRYVKTGNVSRILYSNYPTAEAARAALHTLRQQSPDFAEAWILERKD